MNAYELADAIEDWETGANFTLSIKAGQMLRQQAEKINNMAIWEKKYLDRIAELEDRLSMYEIKDLDKGL